MAHFRVKQKRVHACAASGLIIVAEVVANVKDRVGRQLQSLHQAGEKRFGWFAPTNLRTDNNALEKISNRQPSNHTAQTLIKIRCQGLAMASALQVGKDFNGIRCTKPGIGLLERRK